MFDKGWKNSQLEWLEDDDLSRLIELFSRCLARGLEKETFPFFESNPFLFILMSNR